MTIFSLTKFDQIVNNSANAYFIAISQNFIFVGGFFESFLFLYILNKNTRTCCAGFDKNTRYCIMESEIEPQYLVVKLLWFQQNTKGERSYENY